jgi:hypothetical protein
MPSGCAKPSLRSKSSAVREGALMAVRTAYRRERQTARARSAAFAAVAAAIAAALLTARLAEAAATSLDRPALVLGPVAAATFEGGGHSMAQAATSCSYSRSSRTTLPTATGASSLPVASSGAKSGV